MAIYEYQAIAGGGKTVKGIIDADSPAAARRKLREQSMFPTKIRVSAAEVDAGGAEKRGGGRVSIRDIGLMTRQLAVLLQAGMPLVDTLSALLDQVERARLRNAIFDIRDKVKSGSSLADGLKDHPRIFSPLYVNMVRAGETSGALERVLFRLADIQEHQAKLKAQIFSSLAYPVFMALFAVLVITFLMIVIVPKITMIFEKQKAELPAITKALIATSDFLAVYWIPLGLGVACVFILWRLWVRRPEGRRRWDKFKLSIPLFGTLHLKLVCGRLARTLGTMLQSGLTMLNALDVVKSVIGNSFIEETMEEVKKGVRRGRDLAVPMRESNLFPPMLLHMIELGQRSGEIEDMLIRVADTYDDDVRLTIDALIALMEPVIIMVMGVFVMLLVLAILLPLLQMSSNIR